MPRDRVDDDVAGRDGAVIRGINVDERKCDRLYMHCKTQYPIQRGPRDEFEGEDDS